MTKEDVAEILTLIGKVFMKVEKLEMSPELSQVTLKLSEAGMWTRMAFDMRQPPASIDVRMEKSERSKFFDSKSKN